GTLLESEHFGYEKGAFTGAYGSKPGRVEQAHRGTLFMDEISELDMGLQSKLLQLLQDGQFCRIGAQEDKKVEVRVVCATNRHLETEIQNGTFREDLFYRINVVNLQLPPLRERRGDINNLDGPISLKKLTRAATRELERKVILKVLQANHWNRKQAARALSISYRALLYKIRDAGLPPNRSSRRRPEALAAVEVVAAD